jgi:hypothetical protein
MRPVIQFSCRVTALMLAVLWLCQTPLWAGIYKWRDDQGKIHFTDDKSRIPLKYRQRLQKFKGVVEPKPKSVQEPVEAEKEKEVVAEEKAVEEKVTEEENIAEIVAALEETKKFLENENASHERLVKFVTPTEFNGRNYVVNIRRKLARKKKLAEKLSKFKEPVLIEANSYLTKSIALDESEKMGGEGYLERILALRQRMETQVATKKKIIKRIKARLKKENAK